MKQPAIRITITAERISDDEVRRIERILCAGFDWVHLRYPDSTEEQLRQLLRRIPRELHGRLRLHDHFDLAREFCVGGLHLNGRNPRRPEWWAGPTSRSCHTLEEVGRSSDCDYVTLSPIFDSISKAGYRAAFSDEELRRLNEIDSPSVIALGGISPQTIGRLKPYAFAGYAVKGAIDLFLE